MDAIAAQLAAEFPDRNRGWAIRLLPIREFLFSWTREPLWTLEAAVILVLLITCANVAGLLLARGTTRAHEMAMRVSLGAGRGRLVRQLLTESLMLSLAGGALGILVAAAGLSWIGTLTPPPGLSRLAEVPLNLRLVAATALTSVATGLVFGLAPALAALRSDLAAVLQQTARPAGTQRGRQRLRSALVAGQVALAVVLLVGTGLLLKSFWRMTTRELNFETKGLLTFELRTPQPTYMREIGTYRDWRYYEVTNPPHQILESVRQRLAALPEAVSVAGISNPPVNSLVLSMVPFRLDGQLPAHNLREAPTAAYLLITPTFFATLKAELHGREFDARDTEDAPWVVVVNETAARRFWPDLKMNQQAIGKRIIVDAMPDERPREVVGVVRDIPTRTQQQAQDAVVYVPYTQHPRKIGPWGNLLGQMTYLVRVSSNRDPLSLVPAARRAAAEIAPDRPISNIGTVQGFVAGQLPQFSYYVLVLGAFALVATLLAAIGVYGVMSHAVAQRTREIGVRMALGACPSEVILWVARRGFMLIAIGLACGLAGAAALGQLLASQLWQVAPQDPLTLVSASLLVVTVAAGACYAPVRRAMSLDPTVALRSE
jgi:putative ABC transport system permease protein